MTETDPAIRIVDAFGDEDVARVRGLFRSYAVEYADSVVETFCLQGFDAEVTGLPGKYAPPGGCLLLAMEGQTPAGCVGLRDLGGGTCEMKRLYVAPDSRGRRLGRRLAEEAIRRAESLGHDVMVLDTLPEMPEAIALYRALGFVDNPPHWDCPVARTIFLRKTLRPAGA
jgi:putative acetyltransferase